MTKYIVQGGSPLFGEVHISGAKNAAVAILPAALLVDGVCRIENIPQISDVTVLLKILEQLGAKVRVLNRSDVELDCRHIVTTRAPQELAHKLRASYYLIGALLGRFGEAEVSMPGGCNFGGTRPIDQHVKGFAAMGATVREGDYICAAAEGGRMRGANIYLDVVSVGATMNIMMAAALADGTTVIENAAKEPHIVDLANFLNSMGADIRGAGTDTVKINGVDKLHDDIRRKHVSEKSHTKRQRSDNKLHYIQRSDYRHRFGKAFQPALRSFCSYSCNLHKHNAHDRKSCSNIQVFCRRCKAQQTDDVRKAYVDNDSCKERKIRHTLFSKLFSEEISEKAYE